MIDCVPAPLSATTARARRQPANLKCLRRFAQPAIPLPGAPMKLLSLVFSVVSVLLGGLWLLQGLGLVHVRPILCFVDCEAVQGPSPRWAAAGFILVTLGALALYRRLVRRNRP